jgi:hypothetical protein
MWKQLLGAIAGLLHGLEANRKVMHGWLQYKPAPASLLLILMHLLDSLPFNLVSLHMGITLELTWLFGGTQLWIILHPICGSNHL